MVKSPDLKLSCLVDLAVHLLSSSYKNINRIIADWKMSSKRFTLQPADKDRSVPAGLCASSSFTRTVANMYFQFCFQAMVNLHTFPGPFMTSNTHETKWLFSLKATLYVQTSHSQFRSL